MNKLGERLEELRTEKGLTKTQLAEKLNLMLHTIGRWERKEHMPNIDFIIMLSRFFGVTVGYMVGEEN